MPPAASVLFIAEAAPEAVVLAAHLLALASDDRLRTAAVTLARPRPPQPVVRSLLAENLMPNWFLPPVQALGELSAPLRAADVAVIFAPAPLAAIRLALPRACLVAWDMPAPPAADAKSDALFEWRCLYAALARRASLMGSLAPRALHDLHADPAANGRALRF